MENAATTNGSLALAQNQKKVITIPATEKTESVKLRVAAYARVSTASDDQMNSFAAQNSYYTTLISSKDNWKMVDLYADGGISGVTAEKREDFQRLLTDCRRGLIDRVLVKSISRFARNAEDCLETVRELKSIGVSVFFEEQNIDTGKMTGELLTAVFAAIAQKESESISSNMRWGVKVRMQNGSYLPSSQPFGYKLAGKMIVIDEVRATYVRKIFSMYLDGKNMDEIADYLNHEKISRPELNREWTHHKVSIILRNEKYIGDSLWQKSYTADTLPFRRYLNHGEVAQYYAEETHPPIVEKDVFQRVQTLLSQRSSRRIYQHTQTEADPFSKKVYCGYCGKLLRRKHNPGHFYYACRTHENNIASCPLAPVPAAELEKAFLRLYYKLKYHADALLSPLLRSLLTVRERRMLWSVEVIELNKKISELSSQNQMLAELKKCGGVDPDIFIYKSNELAEQLRAAKLQKERVLSAESDKTIPRTRELMETLDTGPDLLDRFDAELFGELIDKIIVENSERIRFRLKNGLELAEKIERTVR